MIRLLKLRPYTGDTVAPSPNHGVRKAPVIKGIILHATADDGNEALALSWMRSPKSQVSCHLLVSRAGRVTRLVGDQQRAWHAGGSHWRGTTDVNSITLGIEIANRNDGEPYTDAQYGRVAAIVAHYCRQGLSLDDVVSHQAIAAGRKTDPFGWDWERFRSMVKHQLRAAAANRSRSLVYDRRRAERVAADQAVTLASTEAVPPSLAPKATPSAEGAVVAIAPARQRRIAEPPKQRVPAKTTPKPVLRSRTLWLNGVAVLASGGMLVGETLDLAHKVGINPPEVLAKWALFLVGLVNIALRMRTTRPVTCSTSTDGSPPEAPVQLAGRTGDADAGKAATG